MDERQRLPAVIFLTGVGAGPAAFLASEALSSILPVSENHVLGFVTVLGLAGFVALARRRGETVRRIAAGLGLAAAGVWAGFLVLMFLPVFVGDGVLIHGSSPWYLEAAALSLPLYAWAGAGAIAARGRGRWLAAAAALALVATANFVPVDEVGGDGLHGEVTGRAGILLEADEPPAVEVDGGEARLEARPSGFELNLSCPDGCSFQVGRQADPDGPLARLATEGDAYARETTVWLEGGPLVVRDHRPTCEKQPLMSSLWRTERCRGPCDEPGVYEVDGPANGTLLRVQGQFAAC